MLNSGVETIANFQNYVDAFNVATKRNFKSVTNLAFRNRNVVYYFINKVRENVKDPSKATKVVNKKTTTTKNKINKTQTDEIKKRKNAQLKKTQEIKLNKTQEIKKEKAKKDLSMTQSIKVQKKPTPKKGDK
jgi:hypothetical protein